MAKILVIEEGKGKPLSEVEFTEEAKLQTYLEEHPSLIPIEDIDEDAAPLVCIGREVGVPSGSIDLLFIGKDGVLTVVETKLAKSPEARRTVIGQVIEYTSYIYNWTADEVYEVANAYLKRALDEAVEKPGDEDFRAKVERNLRSGKIRLLIAVDKLVEPLRATITFLNENSNFDILLLQVKSFEESEIRKVLIPTLFGYKKRQAVRKDERHYWTEGEFLERVDERCESEIAKTIRNLLEFTKSNADKWVWGSGATRGSFTFLKFKNETRISIFTVFSDGQMWLNFGWMWDRVASESLEFFKDTLNQISGINIPEDAISSAKFPSIEVKVLAQRYGLQRFEEAVLSLCQKIEAE